MSAPLPALKAVPKDADDVEETAEVTVFANGTVGYDTVISTGKAVVNAIAKVGEMPQEEALELVTQWQITGRYNVEVW